MESVELYWTDETETEVVAVGLLDLLQQFVLLLFLSQLSLAVFYCAADAFATAAGLCMFCCSWLLTVRLVLAFAYLRVTFLSRNGWATVCYLSACCSPCCTPETSNAKWQMQQQLQQHQQ